MHVFEFVLGILAIVFGAKLLDSFLKYRHQRRSEQNVDEAWTEKLETLEERVQVLERIVTDKRFDLNKEFKDLGG